MNIQKIKEILFEKLTSAYHNIYFPEKMEYNCDECELHKTCWQISEAEAERFAKIIKMTEQEKHKEIKKEY